MVLNFSEQRLNIIKTDYDGINLDCLASKRDSYVLYKHIIVCIGP